VDRSAQEGNSKENLIVERAESTKHSRDGGKGREVRNVHDLLTMEKVT